MEFDELAVFDEYLKFYSSSTHIEFDDNYVLIAVTSQLLPDGALPAIRKTLKPLVHSEFT